MIGVMEMPWPNDAVAYSIFLLLFKLFNMLPMFPDASLGKSIPVSEPIPYF